MAHFAKLDENNIVLAVHVVNNDVITVNGVESEKAGVDFLTSLHGHNSWMQTSYNAATNGFRKNYAAVGYQYDSLLDAFIPLQPYPSWKLNTTTCQWEAPIVKPEDIEGYAWKWFEINKEWIKVVSLIEN
jgi:hypothetical protein